MDKELKTNSSVIDEHFKFVFESFDSSCLNDAMQYALLGGKKLRGYLVNQSSILFDIDLSKSIWAACSIEALHAYSLVHDDLPAMDNDDLRRGSQPFIKNGTRQQLFLREMDYKHFHFNF